MVERKLETPYLEDYHVIIAHVDRENETDYLPPLKIRIKNLQVSLES